MRKRNTYRAQTLRAAQQPGPCYVWRPAFGSAGVLVLAAGVAPVAVAGLPRGIAATLQAQV